MSLKTLKHAFRRLRHSKAALALPVTFLILFVSTLALISFTYYFAVENVNSQGQTLKVSTAKESFLSMDNSILSTLGQPGSSDTFDLADSGGTLLIQPDSNLLTLSINDGLAIDQTVFNSSIGNVVYELPYTPSAQTGLYLKGDERTIVNQSGSTVSQICIENGVDHPEIHLQYRPTVTYSTGGIENGMTQNTVRIYLVNLNSSTTISSQGEVPLQISCLSTQLSTQTFQSLSQNLTITSVLDDKIGSVTIPISGTAEGAIINLEIVTSNISITRWIL